MEDDGILYLGGAETIMGITEKIKVIQGQRGIYSKNIDSAPTINNMNKNTAAMTPVKPILSNSANSANSAPLSASTLVTPALSALERLKQKQQQV
jgi:hypothetical protein